MEQSEKIWDWDFFFFFNMIPASKEYIWYYFEGKKNK